MSGECTLSESECAIVGPKTSAHALGGPAHQGVRGAVWQRAWMRAAAIGFRLLDVPDQDAPSCQVTWWEFVNAVTARVDHAQGIDGDRYPHALFGSRTGPCRARNGHVGLWLGMGQACGDCFERRTPRVHPHQFLHLRAQHCTLGR